MPLSPLEAVYRSAVGLRGWLYDRGLLRERRLEVPVISVGNITAGGTGKSPVVGLCARLLLDRGRRPAIVSRGYRGSHAGPATVVSRGQGPLVDARVAGDEPVMLASMLPGVAVIVARRRIEGGRLAVRDLGCRSVVLDDGFQHRRLGRDLDLLLLDGRDPFGNGRLLPAGPLREPLGAMSRAGAVLVTRADRLGRESREAIAGAVARHCPRAPVFHSRSTLASLIPPGGRGSGSVDALDGARVICFAGVAKPQGFFDDVSDLGAVVAGTFPFPDHHRFSGRDLERIAAAAREHRADFILTTEKDLSRIGPVPPSFPVHAVRQEISVEEAEAFAQLIEGALP